MKKYRNPTPTVDIIIEYNNKIVLIERKNPPYGYALPGGFVDEGESIEKAAVREAKEETNLEIDLLELLYVYSDPFRDPRSHTISGVFIANGLGHLNAGDDARKTLLIQDQIPQNMAFDHALILEDYFIWKKTGKRPNPKRAL